MISKVSISNFKSIYKQDFELGRVNVFIGENGSGKSNILEALVMLSASKTDDLNSEDLFNKGLRVTRPSLTFNSFLGNAAKKNIHIEAVVDNYIVSSNLTCSNDNDIQANWIDKGSSYVEEYFVAKVRDRVLRTIQDDIKILVSDNLNETGELPEINQSVITAKINELVKEKASTIAIEEADNDYIRNYIIYNTSTNALRGITNESKKYPLGINGEGLDVLLSSFDNEQLLELKQTKFISWLKDIHIDTNDSLKINGYKLGRSNSKLYFTDKFMQRKNNLFSAENANEGALHILFYLALFISKETPKFFAIDNIENALNPMLCRQIIKRITELALKNDKQTLITTHNPAVLDGLNLHDEEQRLFVVKRTDEGHTKIERIKLKPNSGNGNLKLSELWMRGYLGALPSNIF